TPLEILLHPANRFVSDFFGRSERGVRLLSLRTVGEAMKPGVCAGEAIEPHLSLREALSIFVERQCQQLPVKPAQGKPAGVLHFQDLLTDERGSADASLR
ncbi:CBS domain-containing protein, partial [Franconibacter helveticus]